MVPARRALLPVAGLLLAVFVAWAESNGSCQNAYITSLTSATDLAGAWSCSGLGGRGYSTVIARDAPCPSLVDGWLGLKKIPSLTKSLDSAQCEAIAQFSQCASQAAASLSTADQASLSAAVSAGEHVCPLTQFIITISVSPCSRVL
jgi:hypothetical protein